MGVTPNHVVEGRSTVRVHISPSDLVPLLHGAIQLLVGDFVTTAEVVLGAAGVTGIQVKVDTGGSVGVANRHIREDFGDAVELFFASKQTGHVVHLDKEVLLQGVGAHAWVVNLQFAVTVAVIPPHLQNITDSVAINIGVIRLRCGDSNQAEHKHRRRGERGTCRAGRK